MNIRKKITQIYLDYEKRDIKSVLAAIPDNFCFEWPLDKTNARYAGICHNKDELVTQLGDLANNFEFHAYSPTNIIIEGNKAAAQVHLNLTSKKTGDTFDATVAHFWTFENDQPTHLVEYMDSALITFQSS